MCKRTENVYIFVKSNSRPQGLTSPFWEGFVVWLKNPFIVLRVAQYWRFLPGDSVLANLLWLLTVEGEWMNSVFPKHWFIYKYTQNNEAVLRSDSQEPSAIPFCISTHRGSGPLLHNIPSSVICIYFSFEKQFEFLFLREILLFFSFYSRISEVL